ncbi:C-C chemokine receptor type 6a isoform X2 [Conger conger]|uniref:C-C chemokine receptor type 6a isoform X2 n=1 Tax=Conger conger TaxID=82655 RepID=UPI002A5AFBCF|nr:C-C chemokine receptor type 6a isoform X2 [Conger conger]
MPMHTVHSALGGYREEGFLSSWRIWQHHLKPLAAVALPLIIYNEEYNWSMGRWACKLLRGIYSVNLYSGMLLLACISADRYIAIVQARRSFRMRSRVLVYSRVICIAVWVLALGLSIPTFVYYETYRDKHLDFDYKHNFSVISTDVDTSGGQKMCYFWFEEDDMAQIMKVLVPSMQVAVGFFVPLLVMGFCYSSIVVTLLRARNFQRHKAVRVVMAVVVVFIACHLPYNISLLYYTVVLFQLRECAEEDKLAMVLTITETLAYLHSCLNPVLYAFIGVKFRNHFCKILEDLWCIGKRYIYSRRSSRVTSEFYVSRRSTEGSINENASSFTM